MYVIGLNKALIYVLSNAEEFPHEEFASKIYYNPPIRKFIVYVNEIKKTDATGNFVFYMKEPYLAWFQVFSKCIPIKAAGLVAFYKGNDSSKKVLMIKRRGIWDLPKGKVERNESYEETAIREFYEECGIPASVKIPEPLYLTRTYHIYTQNNMDFGKEVKWHAVLLNEKINEFKPQKSEEITEVKWVSREEYQIISVNTYPTIKDILYRFLVNDDEWGVDFYVPKPGY